MLSGDSGIIEVTKSTHEHEVKTWNDTSTSLAAVIRRSITWSIWNSRLAQIKDMVDKGQYFCINRGRQYGKTTLLDALQSYLRNDYTVISNGFSVTDECCNNLRMKKLFPRLSLTLLWKLRCFLTKLH